MWLQERKQQGEAEWDQLEAMRRERNRQRMQTAKHLWSEIAERMAMTIRFLRSIKFSGRALVVVGTAWTLAVLLGPLLFLDTVPLGHNSELCLHDACIPLDFVMLGFWAFTVVGFFAERQTIEYRGWMETLNQVMFRIIYSVLLVGIPVFVVYLWVH
jgi:hypothetical protein